MSESRIYYPDIRPPSFPFGEKAEDTSIISDFEDGSQQSRQKKTRGRRTWELKWTKLSNRDYRILMHFIRHVVKNASLKFWWVNPSSYDHNYDYLDPDREEVEVRITKVDKWENVELRYWTGSIELTEV